MSNIYDIAEKTGFSPSTVARALSGSGYCADKTKKIVLKAAKEMDYAPVQAAKSLKNKYTKKVMLCIPDICNPYYFTMIEGASSELEKHGYHLMLVHSDKNKERELQIIDEMKERMVDGLIFGSFDYDNRLVAAIRKTPVPVILTNMLESMDGEDNFDVVYVDHTKATFIATAELIKRGHRNIVFIGGNTNEQTGRERLLGYRRAMETWDLTYDDEMVLPAEYTRKGGRSAMEGFLKKKREFSGIVTCNDLIAIGAMNACQDAGISIPDEASVISLDNTDYCSCTFPRLTSVNMMQYQIGKNAVDMLIERIKGERDYKKIIVLDPSIHFRNSVVQLSKKLACLPVIDPPKERGGKIIGGL